MICKCVYWVFGFIDDELMLCDCDDANDDDYNCDLTLFFKTSPFSLLDKSLTP